jgi:hypothetical protein
VTVLTFSFFPIDEVEAEGGTTLLGAFRFDSAAEVVD